MGRTTKGDYKHHYDTYQSRPDQIKKRAQRNAARAQVVKSKGADAVKGKDVHHKTPIRSGGTNAPKNLGVVNPSSNRGETR